MIMDHIAKAAEIGKAHGTSAARFMCSGGHSELDLWSEVVVYDPDDEAKSFREANEASIAFLDAACEAFRIKIEETWPGIRLSA